MIPDHDLYLVNYLYTIRPAITTDGVTFTVMESKLTAIRDWRDVVNIRDNSETTRTITGLQSERKALNMVDQLKEQRAQWIKMVKKYEGTPL